MTITKPTTGSTGWDDEVNAAIDRVNDIDALGYYPLTGYGSFHSASCNPTDVSSTGTLSGGWTARIWMKGGLPITRVGTIVLAAASGDIGFNAFAIYSDDGTSLLGQTADDATFWTTAGIRSINLVTPIAASATGRFVRIMMANAFTTVPSIGYCVTANNPGVINGTGLQRRSVFHAGVSSFASTIDPTSLGTATEFLPLFFLG